MLPEPDVESLRSLTEDICRGGLRLLADLGYQGVKEVSLANGRRSDILAVGPAGQMIIVEVKSSVADFRADAKWPEYQGFCDQFYFAVGQDFPQDLIPDEAGLMVCDGYGGAVVREAPETRLSAARRKAVMLKIARVAAMRLNADEIRPIDVHAPLT